MPEVTGYANGVPSWVDLGTTDVADAERFYGGLFGWESDRQSMGENMFYSMQQIGGKNVAAIYDQREEQKETKEHVCSETKDKSKVKGQRAKI